MEDFNALAAALGAGIHDVRSCLILSSDGLVLGAHPESAEEDARPARIKVAALGEPERGFLQFGTEVWCYVRRGPYAALAITGTAARVVESPCIGRDLARTFIRIKVRTRGRGGQWAVGCDSRFDLRPA